MKRPIRKGNHVAGNIYLRDIALFLAIPGFFFLLGYYFVAGPLKIIYDFYFLPFGAYLAINSQVNLGKKIIRVSILFLLRKEVFGRLLIDMR